MIFRMEIISNVEVAEREATPLILWQPYNWIMSGVTCHTLVELVGGGSVINGACPV